MESALLDTLDALETADARGALRPLAHALGDSILRSEPQPDELELFQAQIDNAPPREGDGGVYRAALADVAQGVARRRRQQRERDSLDALLREPEVRKVLTLLEHWGKQTPSELLERCGGHVPNPTAMTRLLARVEEAGLVERCVDADGRKRPRALRPEGYAAVKALREEDSAAQSPQAAARLQREGVSAPLVLSWAPDVTVGTTPFSAAAK